MDELILHFIRIYSDKLGKDIAGADSDFMLGLKKYDWPGNIRELENTIEYAVNIARDSLLTTATLPANILSVIESGAVPQVTLKQHMAKEEAAFISAVLKEYENEKNGVSLAAKALGISRASLYNKINEYDIHN